MTTYFSQICAVQIICSLSEQKKNCCSCQHQHQPNTNRVHSSYVNVTTQNKKGIVTNQSEAEYNFQTNALTQQANDQIWYYLIFDL